MTPAPALAPVAELPPEERPVVDRTREAIAAANLSQADAAAEIGISDAALSQWLRGRYGADPAGIERLAARWLATARRRAGLLALLPKLPAWIQTEAATTALEVLEWCQATRDMGFVSGPAGAGKTTAANRYRATFPNVWLATCSSGSRTIGPCLERVATAVGVRTIPSRSWRIEAEIVRQVAGKRGLLVLDEAQHLDVRSIEALRSLHDACAVGVVLLGNEQLRARLLASRGGSMAQLWSRFGRREHLGGITREEAAAYAAAAGVRDKAVLRDVRASSRQDGSLRLLAKRLRRAAAIARGPITLPAWQTATKELSK